MYNYILKSREYDSIKFIMATRISLELYKIYYLVLNA